MTVKEFTVLLASELIDRGIGREDAATHVLTLAKTLTEEDLKEITEYKTSEDFVTLTDSLAEIIKAKNLRRRNEQSQREDGTQVVTGKFGGEGIQESGVEESGNEESGDGEKGDGGEGGRREGESRAKADTAEPNDNVGAVPSFAVSDTAAFADTAAVANGTVANGAVTSDTVAVNIGSGELPNAEKSEAASDSTRTFAAVTSAKPSRPARHTGPWAKTSETAPTAQIQTVAPRQTTEPQEIILGDDSSVKEKTVLTRRGKTVFALAALLTSPLWLTFSAVLGFLFVLSVCAVCAVIVLIFVLVLAEVAAGGGGFFVGLIYGAVKLFGGYTGTGLYEMGIGIACMGVTLILSFLTYSLAAKTMPYVLKEVLGFWGIALRRLVQLTERFREECNKL